MKGLMAFLDQRIGAIILVGALLAMGGLTWSAMVDAPVEEALLKRIELESGDHRAAISLTKGTEKPILFSPDGRTLLDVSAWETRLKVNGETSVLYRDVYNAHSDGKVAYVTWSNPRYQLEERIEADEDGVTIRWAWMRQLGAPPQNVTVELAQYAYYMEQASLRDRVITYRLAAADPRQDAAPADATPYVVRIGLDREPDLAWFGETPQGVDGVRLRYDVLDPPAGLSVPFLTQRITYERTDAALPPPEGERRAVPSLDEETREVVLRANGLRLVLPLFDGAHKPLLQNSDGRDLVEISGWETTLSLGGGAPVPLYRHPFRVVHDDEGAAVSWLVGASTLEQRISLASDALDVEWWWTQDPDEAPRNLTLEVAHFSRYMENLTADGQRAAWRLNGTDLVLDARLDPRPARLRFGATPEGADSMRAAFRLDAPVGRDPVLVGRMSLRLVDGAPLPVLGPPAERVAAPLLDHDTGVVHLGAGDLHATLSTTRSADHPTLRYAPTDRALLEVSARQSILHVEGQPPFALHAFDHATRVEEDRACTTWEDAAWALRECVRLTSDGMNLTWEWQRAPGAGAVRAELTLAHFAFFLRDPTYADGLLGYLLEDGEGPRHRLAARFDPAPVRGFFGGPPGATDAFRAVYVLGGDEPEGEWTTVAHVEVTRAWE